MIVTEFGGEVPSTVKALTRLPGVGNKTAQVVAAVAFGVPTLAVDTHVFRTSHRIGLVTGKANTPEKVEKQLKRLVAKEKWADLHHILIFHGRYTCQARAPQCETCPVTACCRYFDQLQRLPDPIEGLDARKGKYYCATRRHYFDEPDSVTDRTGTEQLSCPRCGSMQVFIAKTGATTRRVRDYRVQ
jgi:endonuclease-3